MYGGEGGAYRVLVGKHKKRERERPFQTTRWRWEGNVKLDLKESDWEDMG
jgi:hypothetical protein